MLLNKQEILEILPHRDPFLFIDSVESIAGEVIEKNHFKDITIVAHYHTRKDHPIFKGHFPQKPIFPGVCQIEMMAQSMIFVICKRKGGNSKVLESDIALLSIQEAHFRNVILPEMQLKITCQILKSRNFILKGKCKIFFNDRLMADSVLLALLKERSL